MAFYLLCFTVYRLVLGIVAALFGIMTQYEVEKDVFIMEKTVTLPTNRVVTFQFLSKMTNYAKVIANVETCNA